MEIGLNKYLYMTVTISLFNFEGHAFTLNVQVGNFKSLNFGARCQHFLWTFFIYSKTFLFNDPSDFVAVM